MPGMASVTRSVACFLHHCITAIRVQQGIWAGDDVDKSVETRLRLPFADAGSEPAQLSLPVECGRI